MEKSCLYCKSTNIIKRGNRVTKNRGLVQRYFCKDCERRFIINDGFYRMRSNPNKITLCLDLFFRGISTRKIQEHLQAFYPENSHYSNIYRWIVKYSNLISQFTDKLNVNVGNELMSDEMEYSLKGKQSWFVDVMDLKSRYIVSSDFMLSRTLKNMKKVLALAKTKTQQQVSTITTDGLNVYPNILRKTFGLHKKEPKSKIKHNVVIASERGFNYPIERLHNNIRHRTKTFRQFHGSLYSAKSILKGFEIYYNFIRNHQAINCCPYELALPNLKLKDKNKWLELIKLSTKSNII
jgi:transposase-like protein